MSVTITPRDVWPPSPVTDLVGTPGAEGQMLLSWTAPDSNNYVFVTSSPATSYQVRIATYSVISIGGSTVTWWNSATDVTALTAPAVAVAPPAPAFPGTTQYLLLNGLWPGVTYYAMIISADSVGNISGADLHSIPPATQANALVFDAVPPAPLGLNVVQVGKSSFLVSWSSVSAYDLDYYKVYYDSVAPYDFASSTSLAVAAPATSLLITNLSTGTYIFKVTAVDRGVPNYPGIPLESLSASSVTIDLLPILHLPQAPYGVGISSAGGVTLRWMPVTRYADGAAFTVSSAPTVDELSAYHVYRATSPVLGGWTDLVQLSTDTLNWTDLTGGPQYYYHVRAQNSSGLSYRSVLRTLGTLSAFVLASDDQSYLEILSPDVLPVEGVVGNASSAYLMEVSSRPSDLGGRVMKSVEFKAWQGGQYLAPDFTIGGLGWLKLHYDTVSSSVTPSGFTPGAVPRTPENMSVYWYNGHAWVQLYGKLDSLSQTLTVQTKYFGQYQLRTVERAGGFNFNQAGVSNRLVTPNGDGKNDSVVFTFDNPRDSAVSVRIIDMRGKVVVSDLPPGPVSNSRTWDGTANGRSVPGGVYIYQIECEGKTFNGTIVIIK